MFIILEILGPYSLITRKQRELREYFYLATIINKYNFRDKAYAIDYAVIEQIRQMLLGKKSSKETREILSKLFSGAHFF